MHWLLVRHKVEDYARWKPFFDADKVFQKEAGLTRGLVMRNVDDPDEVVIAFKVSDLAQAREFTRAERLGDVMKEAGVVGMPSITFLEVLEEFGG